MIYDGTGTAKNVLNWLNEGDYSCVLEYNAEKRRAYLEDEDDDNTQVRIPVRVVDDLLADDDIIAWRVMGSGWKTYRPTKWVAMWFAEHPPREDDPGVPDGAQALAVVGQGILEYLRRQTLGQLRAVNS